MGGSESKPEESIVIAVAPPPSTAPSSSKKAASGLGDSKPTPSKLTSSSSKTQQQPQLQQPPPTSGRSTAPPVSSSSNAPTITIAAAKKLEQQLQTQSAKQPPAAPQVAKQPQPSSASEKPKPGAPNHNSQQPFKALAPPAKNSGGSKSNVAVTQKDDTTFDDVDSFDLDDDDDDREEGLGEGNPIGTSSVAKPHNEGDLTISSPESVKGISSAKPIVAKTIVKGTTTTTTATATPSAVPAVAATGGASQTTKGSGGVTSTTTATVQQQQVPRTTTSVASSLAKTSPTPAAAAASSPKAAATAAPKAIVAKSTTAAAPSPKKGTKSVSPPPPPQQPSSVSNPLLSPTAKKQTNAMPTPPPSTTTTALTKPTSTTATSSVATKPSPPPSQSPLPAPTKATAASKDSRPSTTTLAKPTSPPPSIVAAVVAVDAARDTSHDHDGQPQPSQHQPMRRATTQAYLGHNEVDGNNNNGLQLQPMPPPSTSSVANTSSSMKNRSSPTTGYSSYGGSGWVNPFSGGDGLSPARSAARTSLSFTDDHILANGAEATPHYGGGGGGGPGAESSATRTSVTSLLSSSSDPNGAWGDRSAQAIGGHTTAHANAQQQQPQPPSTSRHTHFAGGGRSVSLLEFSNANVSTSALHMSNDHNNANSRRQAKTGRVRLPSTIGGLSKGEDSGDGTDLVFSRNITSPTTMSMASGVSRASSIASFRFRSAIPFDFLDDKKLRRDKPTEMLLRRAAEDGVLSSKKRKLSMAALESRHNSLASKGGGGTPSGGNSPSSVPHPPPAPPPTHHTIGVCVVPLAPQTISSATKVHDSKQPHKPVTDIDNDVHHAFPLAPADDLRGPVLVIGDCSDDIVAVVMVLATMEAYCVEEHNKLLSNLFSYVLASGTGMYIALALSQGETMNQLLELLMQHDASLLRPPKPAKKDVVPAPAAPVNTKVKSSGKHKNANTTSATTTTPSKAMYQDAFYDDGADAIDTLLRLKFAEGEQILENSSSASSRGGGRSVSHRYRRGDYSVSRPCLFVSSAAGDAIHIVDWNAEEYSITTMYSIAANCKMTSPVMSIFSSSDPARRSITSTSSSIVTPTTATTKVVSLLAERFPDPMLFTITMTPRPTAVCRVSLPPPAEEDALSAEMQRKRLDLMAKEFRSDFIDIVLPEFVDLPPRGTGGGDDVGAQSSSGGGGGARMPRKNSFQRYQRGSIGSSCSISAQALPMDPNAGNLSCLTVGLDAFTPMEDLLQEWNLEGAGKERRLAVIQQTEAFIEDIEGSLQRAMDYMVAKAPKAMQAAPTTTTMMLDELLSMPNTVQS